MRRLAIAALPLLYAAPILGQSQVQHLPRTAPESATADGTLPSATVPDHPSTPNIAGPTRIVREDPEPDLPIRPAVPDRDQLSGHLRLGVTAGYGTFSGSFASRTPIGKHLAGSSVLNLDLGYGLTRHLELVVSADLSAASGGASCGDCESKSWAIGPMLRYHLVEGTRFNPWLALGAAYRHNTWDFGTQGTVTSIEFARLSIGGDWYVTSLLALGPVLALGLNTASSAPAGENRDLFALYYGGLRLTVDLPGR